MLARITFALFRGDDSDSDGEGDISIIEAWEGRYQMLLWVLAVSVRVAGAGESRVLLRARLVRLLAVVCRLAWVGSLKEFVEQLRGVVWPEQKACSDKEMGLDRVWSEVQLINLK